ECRWGSDRPRASTRVLGCPVDRDANEPARTRKRFPRSGNPVRRRGAGHGRADRGTMTDFATLRGTHSDDRVGVELHRPAQRNAINPAMVGELHTVCARLETNPQILILTGAGADFAAGADIAELRSRGRDEALAGINRTVFDRIAALPLPTIAAV